MAKRMSKADMQGLGALVILGAIGSAIVKFFETVGYVIPSIALIAGIAGYVWNRKNKKAARLSYLRNKYHDEMTVERIVSGHIWQGQTASQLSDSLGSPADVDVNVLKTKRKEIWKYRHQSGNRYGLRITLENNVVVGWDRKD